MNCIGYRIVSLHFQTNKPLSAIYHPVMAGTTPASALSDIELIDGRSFEVFRNTTVNSTLLFTTSYDEFARQAFKLNSIAIF